MLSRLLSLFLTVLAFALAPLETAHAAWPEKPIRLIVPSAPGGAPDGYTLAYGNVVSLATNKSLLATVPYDVDKDLTLVANTLRLSNIMIVNNDVPARNVQELIAYAKKNPGKLAFASDGNGTTAHLGVELFKATTGTHMLHVPYRAATSAVTDLIGGGIQLMMINSPVSGPLAQAGKVRALGISSPQRSPAYPDIPTIAEQGVPGFEVTAWGGIIGPANMPKDIVTRLNAEIRTALASPAVKERFKTLGADPSPSTPEEFREMSRVETAKWAKIVKFSGARID
jgi:tripartite-type tricarboxylate transporter receptor subunit TctC